MKIVCSLALAFVATFAAHADVFIEQKLESAVMNATLTLKIRSNLVRMDRIATRNNMTMFMDLKTDQMTVLMHEQKVMMEKDMKALREQTAAMQKASGLDPSAIEKPKATGVTEKVGEWTAEVYEFSLGKIWIAKDFPNGDVLREQLKKVTAANNGGVDPNKLDVPGMIVKYRMETPTGPITSTVIRAAVELVSDGEFIIPQGYSPMFVPGSSGAPK